MRSAARRRADERERGACATCRRAECNCLFTVDLFNEGVDLPEVDTVLFLRPTESATVFLQQLGRGLRRTRDKAVLTVLDFVGQHRKEFRFDSRYRALTGATPARARARRSSDGFPFLPSGCQIVLDEQAQPIVAREHPGAGRARAGATWSPSCGRTATVDLGQLPR